MGDHRASITITFEMHGIKDTHETWINWSPDSCCCSQMRVDRRICEWLSSLSDKAYEKYDEQVKKERAKEQKAKEKKEYLRLKKIYDAVGVTFMDKRKAQ